MDKSEILNWIYDTIARYGLSLVSRDGYQHYNCDSSAGLGDFNREPFNHTIDGFPTLSIEGADYQTQYADDYSALLITFADNADTLTVRLPEGCQWAQTVAAEWYYYDGKIIEQSDVKNVSFRLWGFARRYRHFQNHGLRSGIRNYLVENNSVV